MYLKIQTFTPRLLILPKASTIAFRKEWTQLMSNLGLRKEGKRENYEAFPQGKLTEIASNNKFLQHQTFRS